MRALTSSQAGRCENAQGGRCRCRCGGAFHGTGRVTPNWLLAKSDPHWARKEGSPKVEPEPKAQLKLEPEWW